MEQSQFPYGFLKGPDQIYPCDNLTTCQPDGRVRLKISREEEPGLAIEKLPPISVPGLLMKIAAKFPEQEALAYKEEGEWKKIDYKEYLETVRTCAKAFLALGLGRHRSVCILGFNSPEWFVADLAAIFAGGIASGIYLTNSAEACFHCLNVSRANICVVQNEKQLEKVLEVKSRLPELKAVVQYEGRPTKEGVISWQELIELGRKQDDEILDQVLRKIVINECCTIIFTSGTVGHPKAVMLSHDNLTWNSATAVEECSLEPTKEVLLSYLPLSHAAAQFVDIYMALHSAACVYFADPDALKGTLINTMRKVQPTEFLAVPRIWEKIYENFLLTQSQAKGVKKFLLEWAMGQAYNNQTDGGRNGWSYKLANFLVLSKIKNLIGLSRCRIAVSAAAPLSPDIKKFFLRLDIKLIEAFGLSECGGGHTIALDTGGSENLNTIGKSFAGTKTKIIGNEGEICLYGRHIFMGYLDDPEKTAETIDEQGWMHSGDLGYLDSSGLLYLTGRLKEILITAGGENIAPVPIEQLVKNELPQISHCLVVGDRKKFLSLLITLKTENDFDSGTPKDELLPNVKDWLKNLNCPVDTVTEVLNNGPDGRFLRAVQKALDRVNEKAISNAQTVKKFVVLPTDFSIATGELGPTMKVKRHVVVEKYAHLIDKMYEH